jgi:hypothetical protein
MSPFRLLPLLLLLASTVACGRDRPAPGTPARLRGEVIASGDYLDQPSRVAVVGDRLVVLDRSAPMVHVFGLAEGNHLGSFGQNGEGPGEYRAAWQVQRDATNPRDAWIYDLSLLRMTRVRFGEAPLPQVQEVVKLHNGAGVFLHPAWLTDSTLVVSAISPQHADGRLLLTDRTGTVLRMIGEAPRHPGATSIPTTVLQHAYEGPVTVRPDRSRFAIAARLSDRLEIYGADGAQLAQVTGSTGFLPAFAVNERAEGVSMALGDDARAGYVDMASTDERIYALFSGAVGMHGGDTFAGREVHVFDWSGKMVSRMVLDAPSWGIAVDPGEKQMFSLRHDPAPAVVRYRLP